MFCVLYLLKVFLDRLFQLLLQQGKHRRLAPDRTFDGDVVGGVRHGSGLVCDSWPLLPPVDSKHY